MVANCIGKQEGGGGGGGDGGLGGNKRGTRTRAKGRKRWDKNTVLVIEFVIGVIVVVVGKLVTGVIAVVLV